MFVLCAVCTHINKLKLALQTIVSTRAVFRFVHVLVDLSKQGDTVDQHY